MVGLVVMLCVVVVDVVVVLVVALVVLAFLGISSVLVVGVPGLVVCCSSLGLTLVDEANRPTKEVKYSLDPNLYFND